MAKTSLVDVDFAELELREIANCLDKAPMKGSTVGLLMASEGTGISVWATAVNRLLSTWDKEYTPLSDKEIALYTQLYGDYWGKK